MHGGVPKSMHCWSRSTAASSHRRTRTSFGVVIGFNRLNALFAIVSSVLASHLTGVVRKAYAAHWPLRVPDAIWANGMEGYSTEI